MNLHELARKYSTDKGVDDGRKYNNGTYGKNYTYIYEQIIDVLDPETILEIGISSGASMKMWREYLPEVDITAIEINPEKFNRKKLESLNIDIIIGDQSDEKTLDNIKKTFDIIIDDGSHIVKDQIKSFETLWSKLNNGGFYVIEDLHTSLKDYSTGIIKYLLELRRKDIKFIEIIRTNVKYNYVLAVINKKNGNI